MNQRKQEIRYKVIILNNRSEHDERFATMLTYSSQAERHAAKWVKRHDINTCGQIRVQLSTKYNPLVVLNLQHVPDSTGIITEFSFAHN